MVDQYDTMNFVQYQAQASNTAIYPERGSIVGLMYVVLGLAGESGEIAEKIKKYFRDGLPGSKKSNSHLTEDERTKLNNIWYEDIEKELGDVLWYLSQIAEELGLNLQSAAKGNINKLASRKERGVLGGSGDNR